jgi:hypothetical protein
VGRGVSELAASRPIEPAGTVIEVEGADGRMRFVSNGYVWLGCVPGAGDAFQGFSAERIDRDYVWWIVSEPMSVAATRSADAALLHTMQILRSTNPSRAVLEVVERIESEIAERAGQVDA